MRIGLITVREAHYHPNRRLLDAGRAQGHDVVLLHPYQVSPSLEGGVADLVGERTPALGVVVPRSVMAHGDDPGALRADIVAGLRGKRVSDDRHLTALELEAGMAEPGNFHVLNITRRQPRVNVKECLESLDKRISILFNNLS